MDRIEQIYTENRAKLDHLEAEPEDWMLVEARLKPQPSRSRFRFVLAAVLALFALVGSFWLVNRQSPVEPPRENLSQLDVGEKFPDLALRNPSGDLIPLSSLQGKVVLVEFWASYSTVCTEEHCYHFLPVYDEFADRGFEIYGVSVDSSASSWISEIERDQLPWPNVTDLQGPNAGIAAEFALQELPETFLLDQSGTIVARNVDASELRSTLSRLFASRD